MIGKKENVKNARQKERGNNDDEEDTGVQLSTVVRFNAENDSQFINPVFEYGSNRKGVDSNESKGLPLDDDTDNDTLDAVDGDSVDHSGIREGTGGWIKEMKIAAALWILLIITIACTADFFEIFGDSARAATETVLVMCILSIIVNVFAANVGASVMLTVIMTVAVYLASPLDSGGTKIDRKTCFPAENIAAINCQRAHSSDFVALNPDLGEVSQAEAKSMMDFLRTVIEKWEKEYKDDVCQIMYLDCTPSCIPRRCGLHKESSRESIEKTNSFVSALTGNDFEDTVGAVLGKDRTNLFNDLLSVMSNITIEEWGHPCDALPIQDGDRCVFHDSESDEPGDATILRKVFEVLFFIFLFAAACKQKNQRVTMPDRVSLGRFIVMIGSAVLIALGQLRGVDIGWAFLYAWCCLFCAIKAFSALLFDEIRSEENTHGSLVILNAKIGTCIEKAKKITSPSSKFYIPYLCAIEATELVVQFISLNSRAGSVDAGFTVSHAVMLSVNIVLMPWMIVAAVKDPQFLLGALVMELLFDNLYIVLSILSSEPPAKLFDHLAFLVPALMVVMTSRGFRDVSERKSKDQPRHMRQMTSNATAAMATLFGVSLTTYVVAAFVNQEALCVDAMGDAMRCARPRLYWKDGLFRSTKCSWNSVRSIVCSDATTIADKDVYAEMGELEIINVSGSTLRSPIPRGLYLAPKLSTIDFSATGICEIPWLGGNININVDNCVSRANWSGLGLDNTILESSKWVNSISKLAEIDLSFNALTSLPRLKLPHLTYMNLESNRIHDFESDSRIRYRISNNPILRMFLSTDEERTRELLRKFPTCQVLQITSPIKLNLKELLLANLTNLNVQKGKIFGTIPSSISEYQNLVTFALKDTDVSGTLPDSLGKLTSLQLLSLTNNKLTGSIPNSIGLLTALNGDMGFSNNKLTGTIPASLGNLRKLVSLSLSNNYLSGTVPASFGNLTSLRWLFLSKNSQLTGRIPKPLLQSPILQHLTICNTAISLPCNRTYDNAAACSNQACHDD